MCVWKKGKHNNRMKASKSRLKDNAWRLTRGRSIRSAMVAFDPQLAFERPHIRCKLTLSLPSSRFLSSLHSKWFLFPIRPLKGLWSLYLLIPKKDGVGPKEKAWYNLSDVNDTELRGRRSEDERMDTSQDWGGTEKFTNWGLTIKSRQMKQR